MRGGIFIALLKGALQPLSCVVTVPLTLLFPSLTTFSCTMFSQNKMTRFYPSKKVLNLILRQC